MVSFEGAALALPGAEEQPHFGAPSFRVGGKIFAQLSADGSAGLVKLPPSLQEWAVDSHPDACSIEPHWGRFGWTRLKLSSLPEELICQFLLSSWRIVAPKRLHYLVVQLGGTVVLKPARLEGALPDPE